MSSSSSHFPVLTANVIVPVSGTTVSIPSLSIGQLTLQRDPANNCTFNVDAAGDLTIDASGNDVNLAATDTVHVLSAADAVSSVTGALQVAGGAGIGRKLHVGSDLTVGGKFICPGELVYLVTWLSGPWGAATHEIIIPMLKYGRVVHAWFPTYVALASVSLEINSSETIPAAFIPDIGAGELWFPIVAIDNGVHTPGSLGILANGDIVIHVLPAHVFQAAGLAGFQGCCVSWVSV
jgi:hypothetical protein